MLPCIESESHEDSNDDGLCPMDPVGHGAQAAVVTHVEESSETEKIPKGGKLVGDATFKARRPLPRVHWPGRGLEFLIEIEPQWSLGAVGPFADT